MDAGLTTRKLATADADGRVSGGELRAILVGGAAVAIFAVVLMVSYMGSAIGGGTSGYTVFALFNRVDGLSVGDDVQVAGVPVGEVVAMTLGDGFRARVALRIEADVALPTDTSAAIHTDGLFGRKFVVLEPGGSEEMLDDGGAITFTQDSLIVGELLDLIIAEGRSHRAATAGGPPSAESEQ